MSVRAALAGVALVLAACPAHADPADTPVAAGTTFVPHLGAGASWTDNILLAAPGNTRDAEVWQLLPGIYLKHDSDSLHLTLDYDVSGYDYSGGQHGHDIYQHGNLFSDTQLVPDWLFVDVNGALLQSTVDPSRNPAISALFPTGNIANQANAAGSPLVRHTFGDVQLLAEYTWGVVHYQPVGTVAQTLPNAANQDGTFRLGTADQNSRLTWDASFVRQYTRYTSVVSPPWLYEEAMGDLGWLVAPGLRLLGEGGKESDLAQSVSAGGLKSSVWSAGFDWNPDRLNELRLMAGRRFFGNTYQALARHQSRLFTLQASYSEAPTTNANRLTLAAPPQDVVTIPGAPTFQRIAPDAYVLKAFDAKAALTGRLTELGVEVSSTEQNYLTLNGVASAIPVADRYRTGTVYMTRRMGAQLQAVLSASLIHTDLREAAGERYNDQRYSAALNDQVGERTTVSLSVQHWQRSGSQVFKTDVVTLNATMSFGNGPTGAFPNAPIVPGPAVPAAPLPAQLTPFVPGAMTPGALAFAAPGATVSAAP